MWETQSSSYHLGMVFVAPIKKSDVGMVYEWVYQIIYDDHNPWIHYTYLIILSLYIGDYHAGWS